jgi:uncharacterized membrane protein
MNQKDTMKRTIVKTLSFKIITTTTTALIIGIKGAIIIHILMTLIFIFHERLWNRIKWGKVLSLNKIL